MDPAGGGAESAFLTAGDGVRLHYLRWRSRQSPPSAVVVFLHGIASHAGWFAETAADLNRQGVEVYGLDRRGSGRSGGPRGHLVAPMARLPIPLTPELYTANPPYRDFIRADPLRLLEATTRFFWETARLDRRRRAAAARLELPVLLLQGESDEMMDVPATRRWFAGLAGERDTYRGYPGAGHTLDFEPDRAPYLNDLLGWLSATVRPVP